MVKLTIDELLILGQLSGLTRAEAARMILEADQGDPQQEESNHG